MNNRQRLIAETAPTEKPDELLQQFLRALIANRVPMVKAIGVAAKVLKEYKTPDAIGRLTDLQLIAAGIDEAGLRKQVLAAIRKGGFSAPDGKATKTGASTGEGTIASASNSSQTSAPPKKRKRDGDVNEFLPDRPEGEEVFDSLDFDEILDEEALKNKWVSINRAPVMTVWAMVVLERQGFKREEALSIALAFTQINALYGGVAAGVYRKGKEKEYERALPSAQPYVDLMGRSPLCRVASQWRAMLTEGPIQPSKAYSYIKTKLMYHTPRLVGALRLLANTFTPTELNERGYSLYLHFRPDAKWAKSGKVSYDTILSLRKSEARLEDPKVAPSVKQEAVADPKTAHDKAPARSVEQEAVSASIDGQDHEHSDKIAHRMTLEEFEAMLDDDPTFDNVDLEGLSAAH